MRLNQFINETTVNIVIKKPNQFTKEEKKVFIDLVLSGNQNTPSHVKNTFPKLVWVALLYEGNEIKAVSSLKKGKTDAFENAGVPELADKYPYEIGFSYTSEDSRGKGYNSLIKKKLFNKVSGSGIFGTIRITNKASIIANTKLGFKVVGGSWQGIVTKLKLYVLDN